MCFKKGVRESRRGHRDRSNSTRRENERLRNEQINVVAARESHVLQQRHPSKVRQRFHTRVLARPQVHVRVRDTKAAEQGQRSSLRQGCLGGRHREMHAHQSRTEQGPNDQRDQAGDSQARAPVWHWTRHVAMLGFGCCRLAAQPVRVRPRGLEEVHQL